MMYKEFFTKKLGKIAEIQFGLYQKKEDRGAIKYLHSSHFDEHLNPTNFDDCFIELDSKNEKFLLQTNDVILTGKGQRIFAWAYDEQFGKTVPSSLFYIIRTNQSEVLGSYLASYLNTNRMQHELTLIGSGSSITSIPKKELQEIDIVLPPIEEQTKIVSIVNLFDEDISLTSKVLEKKRSLKKGVLNKLINNKI